MSLRSYVQQLSPPGGSEEHKERKRVVLIGHSLGGAIAQLYAKSGAPVSGLVLAAPVGVEANDVKCMREKFFGQAESSAFAYYFDVLVRSVARPWWLRSKVLPLLFGPATFSTTLATELTSGPAPPGLLSFADDVELLLDGQLPFKCVEESIGENSDADRPPPPSPFAPLPTLLLQPENDSLLTKESYDRISQMWEVDSTVVPNQGHNIGDVEWEESSMPLILEFLRTTQFPDPGHRRR